MAHDKDRSALELQLAELTARMKSLDRLRKPEHVAEWAALYELRTGSACVGSAIRPAQRSARSRECRRPATNAAVVARLTKLFVEHLIKTARQPELIPLSDDPLYVLDHGVQSRDVAGSVGR